MTTDDDVGFALTFTGEASNNGDLFLEVLHLIRTGYTVRLNNERDVEWLGLRLHNETGELIAEFSPMKADGSASTGVQENIPVSQLDRIHIY